MHGCDKSLQGAAVRLRAVQHRALHRRRRGPLRRPPLGVRYDAAHGRRRARPLPGGGAAVLRLFPFDRGVVDLLRRAPLRLRREHGLVERGRRHRVRIGAQMTRAVFAPRPRGGERRRLARLYLRVVEMPRPGTRRRRVARCVVCQRDRRFDSIDRMRNGARPRDGARMRLRGRGEVLGQDQTRPRILERQARDVGSPRPRIPMHAAGPPPHTCLPCSNAYD